MEVTAREPEKVVTGGVKTDLPEFGELFPCLFPAFSHRGFAQHTVEAGLFESVRC